MNNDLIKRSLAISYAISGLVRRIDGEDWIRTSEVKQSLNDVPTVEAYTSEDLAKYISTTEDLVREKLERPQGEWIAKEETPASVSYYCSVCKAEGVPITPFCPWCGAYMKGDAE